MFAVRNKCLTTSNNKNHTDYTDDAGHSDYADGTGCADDAGHKRNCHVALELQKFEGKTHGSQGITAGHSHDTA